MAHSEYEPINEGMQEMSEGDELSRLFRHFRGRDAILDLPIKKSGLMRDIPPSSEAMTIIMRSRFKFGLCEVPKPEKISCIMHIFIIFDRLAEIAVTSEFSEPTQTEGSE